MKFETYKFETYALRFLFGSCLLVCGLIMAAMVVAKPQPLQIAHAHHVSAPQVAQVLTTAPSSCLLAATDLICVRAIG